MNPDDIARILDDLGERIGPAGEYVFALAVRQVYIDGVLNIGLGLLCIPVAVVVGLVCWRSWRSASTQGYGAPDPFIYLMFGGSAVVAALILALFAFASGLPKLLNPEYAAIRDILGAIR